MAQFKVIIMNDGEQNVEMVTADSVEVTDGDLWFADTDKTEPIAHFNFWAYFTRVDDE